jgi:hypothetical protein
MTESVNSTLICGSFSSYPYNQQNLFGDFSIFPGIRNSCNSFSTTEFTESTEQCSFSLCALCSLWFLDQKIIKSLQICETITHLKFKLKAPLIEINAIETQLIDLYQQEKMLREKSMIVEGIRILDDPDAICLKECESQINRCIRQKAKIEKEHKDDFDKLKKNVEEEKRIRDKDKVYRVDVELDQIMTCFKMSFVNLCSFFLIKCFEGEKFELLTLMESIFQLDGSASVSDDRKVINLEMNPKEPDLMDKLYKGLQILNTMQVYDLEGRVMGFKT